MIEKKSSLPGGVVMRPPGAPAVAPRARRLHALAMAWALVLLLALAGSSTLLAASKNGAARRVDTAAMVLRDAFSAPDKSIPQDLFDRASCIGVFPSVWKGAFLFGGRFGKGVLSCRTAHNGWSAPASFRIEGGNIGFQIGGTSTDLVLVFLGEKSMKRLMRTNFTLGLDGAAAAGPLGRSTSGSTDALLGAEIVSYAKSRGLFAGVSFDGATLRPAHKANRRLYGYGARPRDLLGGEIEAPESAAEWLRVLEEYSPRKRESD